MQGRKSVGRSWFSGATLWIVDAETKVKVNREASQDLPATSLLHIQYTLIRTAARNFIMTIVGPKQLGHVVQWSSPMTLGKPDRICAISSSNSWGGSWPGSFCISKSSEAFFPAESCHLLIVSWILLLLLLLVFLCFFL